MFQDKRSRERCITWIVLRAQCAVHCLLGLLSRKVAQKQIDEVGKQSIRWHTRTVHGRVHGRDPCTTVYTACIRPVHSLGHSHVHIRLCTRLTHGRVHGRLHGPCTAVYTAAYTTMYMAVYMCIRPCIRPFMGRVRGL